MNENNKNNNGGFGLGDLAGWIVPIVLIFSGWGAVFGIIILLAKLVKLGKAQEKKRRQSQQYQPGQQTQQARPAQQTAQPVYTAQPAQPAYTAQTVAPKSAANAKLERDRRNAKTLSVLLTIASIALAAIGVVSLSRVIPSILYYGIDGGAVAAIMRGVACVVSAGMIFGVRGLWKRKNSLHHKYIALIGERDIMPVGTIVSGIGRPDKRVRRELQDMIDNGFFVHGAYIDAELDCLVFSAQAAMDARMGRENTAQQATAEQAAT
jgi:hypothetical protein